MDDFERPAPSVFSLVGFYERIESAGLSLACATSEKLMPRARFSPRESLTLEQFSIDFSTVILRE